MGILSSEWEDRIAHWSRTLEKDLYAPLGEICWESFMTMEHLPLDEVKKQKFQPMKPGTPWGHTWEYGWFRGKICMPREAAGQRIVMNLAQDGEATLFVNDKAFGTYRADWIEVPHHYLEDNTLTVDAQEGDTYEIYMEIYAGHHFPSREIPNARRATGPILEGDYEDPMIEGEHRRLGKSTFGIWNEDAYQLYMDVKILRSLLEVLDEDSLRAVKVAEALEQFTLCVDFEQGYEERRNDYQKARELLKPALEAENGSTMPQFYAVGNAHIDLAWLWPFAETHRKTARTFAAQLRHLEEYPEYQFIQSQPAIYEMCRENYPELFERIVQAQKEGRWIADGAMWVEPDTNMAGGEALIRQLLYGKKYFKEVFNTDSQVLWLPDTFGYTGALPQILKGCGVPYLVTQKIFWSYNGGEPFPYHYFNWEGIDGTKVTAFLPTNYTYKANPQEAVTVWKDRGQKRDLEGFLYPIGYGDGGGGPCRDHIEAVRRMENLEGCVKMKMTSPLEFFRHMEEMGGPKHTYAGELYLAAHRGTYTSQAQMKKNNRRAEGMLRELEMWSALAAQKGQEYPAKELEALWKTVLLHQFHDILPGTSIGRVYEEANAEFAKVFERGAVLKQEAMESLGEKEGYSVWNSLGFSRKAVVSLPEIFSNGACADGVPVPVKNGLHGPEALLSLPAAGVVSLIPAEVAEAEEEVTAKQLGDGYLMENSQIRAKIDTQGQVVSFCLKMDGKEREFAAEPMNRFCMYKDVPRRYDSWDIDSNYRMQEIEHPVSKVSVQIVQSEGLRAVLEVTGVVGHSSYTQKIRLDAESSRLEFETTIDWNEQHRLLKVAFPVRVYADNACNEIQFGYVQRPTHRSRPYDQDRFEVCNHRYTALYDQNQGAAILNDCKYGISMNGNAMELTLLRAATVPERYTDRKKHTFTYAFTAWEGSFYDSDVVKQGYELNTAVSVEKIGCTGFSAFWVEQENVILDTVKLAEDGSGDMIIRLYESKKAQTDTVLHMNMECLGTEVSGAYLCDMLEQEKEILEVEHNTLALSLHPFEILTIRLKVR
ncbi:MAG: alpha-mannosidase [Oliverpabstia sp.]